MVYPPIVHSRHMALNFCSLSSVSIPTCISSVICSNQNDSWIGDADSTPHIFSVKSRNV
jgi:hypothetical protein